MAPASCVTCVSAHRAFHASTTVRCLSVGRPHTVRVEISRENMPFDGLPPYIFETTIAVFVDAPQSPTRSHNPVGRGQTIATPSDRRHTGEYAAADTRRPRISAR